VLDFTILFPLFPSYRPDRTRRGRRGKDPTSREALSQEKERQRKDPGAISRFSHTGPIESTAKQKKEKRKRGRQDFIGSPGRRKGTKLLISGHSWGKGKKGEKRETLRGGRTSLISLFDLLLPGLTKRTKGGRRGGERYVTRTKRGKIFLCTPCAKEKKKKGGKPNLRPVHKQLSCWRGGRGGGSVASHLSFYSFLALRIGGRGGKKDVAGLQKSFKRKGERKRGSLLYLLVGTGEREEKKKKEEKEKRVMDAGRARTGDDALLPFLVTCIVV